MFYSYNRVKQKFDKKKKNYVFGTVVGGTVFIGCSQEDAPVKTKNYYGNGAESSSSDTPKEAYYALFAVVGITIFLVAWGLKKLRKK